MRPLDPLGSIKFKLGVVIVAAVGVTLVVLIVAIRTPLPLWLGAIGALVLALAMVQFLARGMTSPLREMAHAAQAMGTGDYSRRVAASSRDEVGQLARTFNKMAAELAEVDRVRKDLIANVSHELRTPISALQAVLENLVDGVEPPDPQMLQTMLLQVERLGRLVSQLLDLSKLESGTLPLERRPFELKPVIEQAAREASTNASHSADKSVTLRVSVRPDDLTILGDSERVHQVLANLLDNAVRHSPPGGAVEVVAEAGDGRVQIAVVDEGPGIPAGEAERVFERFYRSDSARAATDGGSGLGLAIARWIVDLHGGDIYAESGSDEGCRMIVHLPRPAA
ncbi:MAG TPA: ATP-binding protein [Actinomycetota bacterium]|nr:ATP-binding protein [Actinomycetota bacterium]